jgi:hypothetical protein
VESDVNERERLFAKVAEGPKGVRFEVLVKLMELWGFSTRYNSKGDGAIFRHSAYGVMITAAKPHHGPVKAVYVRACLNAIEEVQIREAKSDA